MKPYTLPELPYSHSALEPHYSARLLRLHHEKHHAAYVDGANDTIEKITRARQGNDFGAIAALQKSLAFFVSGHILHSLFWNNMSPHGGDRPDAEMKAALCESFGSVDGFQNQFSETALGVQGAGWAALAWEPLGQRLVVEQIYDHQNNLGTAAVPILVLDMWEHAYYLQYQNVKADWVRSFWKVVDWQDVTRRFEKVRLLDLALEHRSPTISAGAVEHAAGARRFWPMRPAAGRGAREA